MTGKQKRNLIACLSALLFIAVFVFSLVYGGKKGRLDFSKNAAESVEAAFSSRFNDSGLKFNYSYYAFKNLSNGGVYTQDGHACELSYPMNEKMLANACEKFRYINDSYLSDKDISVYLSVIPDKNYYLAETDDCLYKEYRKMFAYMRENTEDFARYIDISELLSADDFYTTDTHWKQENILDVAQKISEDMGASLSAEYAVNILEEPFFGVFGDRTVSPLPPDTIKYLTNDALNSCTVASYDTGEREEKYIYDMEKAKDKNAYSMFLSGTVAVLTVENPQASSQRELIVFRDSFSSSLMPLFAEAYSKITLLDIRYVQSELLGNYVDFSKADDVLFIYSTLLLNNSLALK